MRKIALLILLPLFVVVTLVYAHFALAETRSTEYESFGVGRVRVVLHDTACDRGLILAQLMPEWKDKFQSAEIVIIDLNRTLPACWTGQAYPGYVLVVDELGNTGTIELKDFAPQAPPKGI